MVAAKGILPTPIDPGTARPVRSGVRRFRAGLTPAGSRFEGEVSEMEILKFHDPRFSVVRVLATRIGCVRIGRAHQIPHFCVTKYSTVRHTGVTYRFMIYSKV